MNQSTETFIKVLCARQSELKLHDGEFAARIGISRPLWVQVRSGSKAVGLQLLQGVARAFPDLDDQVLAFLRGDSQ